MQRCKNQPYLEASIFLEAAMIVLDAPLVLAIAAVISSVSGLIWSVRRRRLTHLRTPGR
jgi:hypothetical protein